MYKLFVIILGLTLFLTACSPNGGTFTEPGTPITLQRGSRFTIELPSNVTTGYSWEFSVPVDTKYLKVLKTYYTNPNNGLVGSGGTQGWIIEAMQPGSTSINLEYKRPWEETVPPVQLAAFTVIIK